MVTTSVNKVFIINGDESASDELKNNLEVVQEAGRQDINAGLMVAQMEIARQLDRIANALEMRG